ncbi:MAG: CHRD domain-containing protein [Actinomycetota bacterium]|nr:CHRD domain-containing protein [Actinomycetota bacterium]
MRMLRRVPAFAAVLMVLAIGVAGSAAFQPSTASTVAVLHSTMTGAREVGHVGDLDAKGSSIVFLNAANGQVCYLLRATGLSQPPTAAHIHIGDAGTAGPVVIPLPLTGGHGVYSGCIHADKTLVQSIIDNPGGFYTNIHTSDFPAGAIRGQLSPIAPAQG